MKETLEIKIIGKVNKKVIEEIRDFIISKVPKNIVMIHTREIERKKS